MKPLFGALALSLMLLGSTPALADAPAERGPAEQQPEFNKAVARVQKDPALTQTFVAAAIAHDPNVMIATLVKAGLSKGDAACCLYLVRKRDRRPLEARTARPATADMYRLASIELSTGSNSRDLVVWLEIPA